MTEEIKKCTARQRGRRKKIRPEREKMQFSWQRFAGDFSGMTEEEKKTLGPLYLSAGKDILAELDKLVADVRAKTRYEKATGRKDDPEKTHFIIAGGNYTYRFILPWILKFVAKKHPFLQIKLQLLELETIKDYPSNIDILLTGAYDYGPFFNIPGTHNTEIFFEDEVHLITSKKTFKLFENNKQAVLDNVGLIFARIVADSTFTKNIASPPYYALFSQYIKAKTRLSIDAYFVAYDFMMEGKGILQGFSSLPDKREVIFLTEEPLMKMQRYFVYNTQYSEFTKSIVEDLMANKDKIFPKNEKELLQMLNDEI